MGSSNRKPKSNFKFTGERVPYKGATIQTYTFGSGDKVIFAFPSFPHSGFYFQLFTRYYDDTQFRFITFDLPGWGGWSHNIFVNKEYDFYENVEIAKEILKYYNVNEFSLMGYSFGGAMAIKLASQLVDKLKKLVIVSGVVDYKIIKDEPMSKLVGLMKSTNATWLLKYVVMKETRRYMRLLAADIDQEFLYEYKDAMENASPKILLESAFALFNVDLKKEIEAIRLHLPPTLIVNSIKEEELFKKEAVFLAESLGVENICHITGLHDDFILRPKAETVHKVMEFLLEGDYRVNTSS